MMGCDAWNKRPLFELWITVDSHPAERLLNETLTQQGHQPSTVMTNVRDVPHLMHFDGRWQIDCRLSKCTFSSENGCAFGRKRKNPKTAKYIFVRKRNWPKTVKILIFGAENEIRSVSKQCVRRCQMTGLWWIIRTFNTIDHHWR